MYPATLKAFVCRGGKENGIFDKSKGKEPKLRKTEISETGGEKKSRSQVSSDGTFITLQATSEKGLE